MTAVLICAPDPLADELHHPLLWRDDLERHLATRFDEALLMAVAARPRLVVLDRDTPQAERLVEDLRANPTTRDVSIVVVARGDLDPDELRLLEAGANAILRFPASSEWDGRLARLMDVPTRREVRIPVRLEFEARLSEGVESAWGTLLNLSASGMLVELRDSLPLGRDLDFSFRLHGSDSPIVGCARVVRHADDDRFGAEFYGVEGDGVERIRRFVDAAARAGGAGGTG